MRILLTCDPELPVPPKFYGGIERIVDLLVRELRLLGHTVGLVAHPESTSPADYHQSWPTLRSQNMLDSVQNTFTLAKAVREFNPDVIHSFSRLLYLFPQLLRRYPCLMSYQREPTARTVQLAYQLSQSTLKFTGCSESISKIGRRSAGEWTAIPNGVEPGSYEFVPEVQADAPLVFLSRIERIKGPDWAVQIAKAAGRKLIIAGNHAESGPEAEFWKEKILPEVGRNGVEYIGPVDDAGKNQLLGKAAALLVPVQWDEPFGIVFAEALACGTPVISCPRGSLPEIVESGVDGFLIRSVEEGVQAVSQIDKLSRQSCRQKVMSQFTGRVIAEQYVGVYRQLCHQSL